MDIFLVYFNKLLVGKTFIYKIERLNVKQRSSRWDSSLSRLIWIYAVCKSLILSPMTVKELRVNVGFKGTGYTYKGDNCKKCFCPFWKGSIQGEQILSFKCRPLYRRDMMCRKGNRKSQKLCPMWKWQKIHQMYQVPLNSLSWEDSSKFKWSILVTLQNVLISVHFITFSYVIIKYILIYIK